MPRSTQVRCSVPRMGHKTSKFYREPQVDDNCRIHCINAVCGKGQLTLPRFNELCDQYDEHTQVSLGSSRTFFMPPTGDKNIFQFCLLHLKKWQTGYIAPGSNSGAEFNAVAVAHGITRTIVFDSQHAWALRRKRLPGGTFSPWLELDSRDIGDPREIDCTIQGRNWGYVYVITQSD